MSALFGSPDLPPPPTPPQEKDISRLASEEQRRIGRGVVQTILTGGQGGGAGGPQPFQKRSILGG